MKPKPGHPHKFTTHNVYVAARMLAGTEAHDVADLQRLCFPHVTAKTIQKRLGNCGLKSYIHHRKPFLSLEKKKKCLEWAQAHRHWTIDN
jgi:transposase